MKILYFAPQDAPRSLTEAFRFAATVSGFHGLVCQSAEDFQAQSRQLTAKEEIHFLLCSLADRSVAEVLLAEHGFIHSLATTHQSPLTATEKRDLHSGFSRHVLPIGGGEPSQAQENLFREGLLSTFQRWKIPRLVTLENEIPYATCHRMFVQTSGRKAQVLLSVEEFLLGFSRLTSPRFKSTFIPRALEVTDEFLLNAIAISSGSAEAAIEVAFGFDGGTFGVSVSDARGALLPWTFFRKVLGNSADTSSLKTSQSPSLGLGLRSSFALSRSLTAQVAGGRFCCMTALIPYARSLGEFDGESKRLEYFGL
jgi:hypothetical protein